MASRVLPDCAIIQVQSWAMPASVPESALDVVGAKWPMATGLTTRGWADVLCIGPTDWLVVWPEAAPVVRSREIAAALRGSTFRTTNLLSALVRIELGGRESRSVLSRSCSLNVNPDDFGSGRCARIRFAGLPVVLRCHRTDTFEFLVARSYRAYLFARLADAGA